MGWEIVSPTGGASREGRRLAKRVGRLGQCRVGLLSNQKPNAEAVLGQIAGALEARAGRPLTVRWYRKRIQSQPMPEELRQTLLRECDVVIHGVGD